MLVFQVRQIRTGAILWLGSARNECAALDAMAHQEGYYDFSDIPEHMRSGGLVVERV